jgi:hypothetical protein
MQRLSPLTVKLNLFLNNNYMEHLIRVPLHAFKISKMNLVDYGIVIINPKTEKPDNEPKVIKYKK